MCNICKIEDREEKDFRDDDELWRILPELEGQERADALSQLAIGTCKDFAGKTSIFLAESANKIYWEHCIPEDSIDYMFTYAAIAENKAYIEDFKGAVEAGRKAWPLVVKHEMQPTYGDLKWDIIEWMVKGGMYHEARVYLEEVIAAEYEEQLWNS